MVEYYPPPRIHCYCCPTRRRATARYCPLPTAHCPPPPSHRYRVRGGESYADLVKRLDPIVLQLERETQSALVVSHMSTLQVLHGYFTNKGWDEIGKTSFPAGVVIQLTPNQYGWVEERFVLDPPPDIVAPLLPVEASAGASAGAAGSERAGGAEGTEGTGATAHTMGQTSGEFFPNRGPSAVPVTCSIPRPTSIAEGERTTSTTTFGLPLPGSDAGGGIDAQEGEDTAAAAGTEQCRSNNGGSGGGGGGGSGGGGGGGGGGGCGGGGDDSGGDSPDRLYGRERFPSLSST